MDEAIDKNEDFPFGYGYCACGCGKLTKIVSGKHLRFFSVHHNPKFKKKHQPPRIVNPGPTIYDQLAVHEVSLKPAKIDIIPTHIGNPVFEKLGHAAAWIEANREYSEWFRKDRAAKTKESQKKYQKLRTKTDPAFKLMRTLRSRLAGVLRKNRVKKDTKTIKLVGCSLLELKAHLEGQFKPGMTWDNHGQWHIDHIIPCCAFDLTIRDERSKCFHYTNLQPLWAKQNLKKDWRAAKQSRKQAQ